MGDETVTVVDFVELKDPTEDDYIYAISKNKDHKLSLRKLKEMLKRVNESDANHEW